MSGKCIPPHTPLYIARLGYTRVYLYSTKKLRKMCSSAYCSKYSRELEIQILECYKVSFDRSNETSFKLVASAVAGKNNVKVD